MIYKSFWKNKKVFITGHTGFKGSWLCLWLYSLGAKVTGYAMDPPTNPSLYNLAGINQLVTSVIGDIRDKEKLYESLVDANPDIIIHMAAQPLVRASYQQPAETYEVNVLGTVYLLDAIRRFVSSQKSRSIRAVINVTTDKCYENHEWPWGYRENDVLGGFDPYSNSKACSEFITSSYRNSFFHPSSIQTHGIALGSARAGNVIGGGDWAEDRLIPDCIRALSVNKKIHIRNPKAIRPWQHVLEPLSGYLLLAQKLYMNGSLYASAWNFGPDEKDCESVEWVVKTLCQKWGGNVDDYIVEEVQEHEASFLKLDCSKAKSELGWFPKWSLEKAVENIVQWNKALQENKCVQEICFNQIEDYSIETYNG